MTTKPNKKKGDKRMTPFERLINDSDYKKKAIAERMGMSRSNFYKKQKKPRQSFNAEQLDELSKILEVPLETVFDAVLKKQRVDKNETR